MDKSIAWKGKWSLKAILEKNARQTSKRTPFYSYRCVCVCVIDFTSLIFFSRPWLSINQHIYTCLLFYSRNTPTFSWIRQNVETQERNCEKEWYYIGFIKWNSGHLFQNGIEIKCIFFHNLKLFILHIIILKIMWH